MIIYSSQYGLSLKAVAADPIFALGELELRKKQIIDRLMKEGLFEINKRLPVPLLPQRIGLVASKDSFTSPLGENVDSGKLEGNF